MGSDSRIGDGITGDTDDDTVCQLRKERGPRERCEALVGSLLKKQPAARRVENAPDAPDLASDETLSAGCELLIGELGDACRSESLKAMLQQHVVASHLLRSVR